MTRNRYRSAASAVVALLWATASGATPTSSSYNVSFITTPGTAVGDIVVVGAAIFAGVGDFGAQSVVRIDGGGTTVLADGFSALGGFAYDAVNDRLLVGDNFDSGTTGDTLYAIPDPFGSPGSPAAALGLELLASGSIPGYADIVIDPADPSGDSVFVSDASANFPPLGVVLQITLSTQTLTPIQSGLQFAAGLATDGTSLFFGDSLLAGGADLASVAIAAPTGPPTPIGHYASGLLDAEYAPDGSLLISSGDSILRVDPISGASSVVASGFGFAAGLFAAADGTIYAMDGFAASGEQNRIWVFSAVPEPASAALLAGGIAGLALCRRRDAGAAQSGSRSRKRTGTVTRP